MTKIPKELSLGEEALALHLDINGIKYEREVVLDGREWRYDFLIGENLLVEVHGAIWQRGAHSRGAGLERDYSKMNAAVLAGYSVLQFSTAMVESGEAIGTIQAVVGASRT